MTVDHAGTERGALLTWVPADETMRRSHGNELDATETGAYAVAVAALHAVDGWRNVRRAAHATGADLLMVRTDDPEAFVKLEVSGHGRRRWALGAVGAEDSTEREDCPGRGRATSIVPASPR